jgi:hypothetical protein
MVLLSELSFLEYPILDKPQQPLPRFQSYFMQGRPDYDVNGVSVVIKETNIMKTANPTDGTKHACSKTIRTLTS